MWSSILYHLSHARRHQRSLHNVRETFEKVDSCSLNDASLRRLAFFPCAILISSEFRDKAEAYFAGLTCYYERLIAERRHRTPVARLYFQPHPFEYTKHVLLDRKRFLVWHRWTAQRSKVFQKYSITKWKRPRKSQLDLFIDLANDICRHICLTFWKYSAFCLGWRRFLYASFTTKV